MEKIKLTSRDQVLFYDGVSIIEKVSVKNLIKDSEEVLLSNGVKIKMESNKTGDFRRTDYKRTEFRKEGYLGFIRNFEEGSTDKYHQFYNAILAKKELKIKLNKLNNILTSTPKELVLDTENQEYLIKLNKKIK